MRHNTEKKLMIITALALLAGCGATPPGTSETTNEQIQKSSQSQKDIMTSRDVLRAVPFIKYACRAVKPAFYSDNEIGISIEMESSGSTFEITYKFWEPMISLREAVLMSFSSIVPGTPGLVVAKIDHFRETSDSIEGDRYVNTKAFDSDVAEIHFNMDLRPASGTVSVLSQTFISSSPVDPAIAPEKLEDIHLELFNCVDIAKED